MATTVAPLDQQQQSKLHELTQAFFKNTNPNTNKENFFNPASLQDKQAVAGEFANWYKDAPPLNDTQRSSLLNASAGPHYEIPNLASMLYEYTNKEQERISQGFRIGNFVSLRDLPKDFTYGNVLNAQKEKIESNIVNKPEPKTYVELANNGGYFSKFDWKPDPYARFLESQYNENHEKKEKQAHLHGDQPFVSTSKIPDQFKHLSPFDASCGTGQMISFLFSDDPYESTRLEVMKSKWLQDSKILYGEFKPAHFDFSLRGVNKQHLPEVVGYLKRSLLQDWSDISFVIGTNPEDFIEMRFDVSSLDSPKGLHTYLNNILNNNDFVIRYQLRRVTPYWNHFSDNGRHVYYMLAPPWAKVRRPVLYLKQIQEMNDRQALQSEEQNFDEIGAQQQYNNQQEEEEEEDDGMYVQERQQDIDEESKNEND